MDKKPKKLFNGIFLIYKKLATKNFVLGQRVYGEDLVQLSGEEYRFWNPNRSKIAAAIRNGLKKMPIKKGSTVLYLGCAEGTTVSHLSDIVEEDGVIFGIDISAKVMSKFLYLCNNRKNLVPILADAANPLTYKKDIEGVKIDVLFQDISQKNQVEIFLKNARMYLRKRSTCLLSLKARSISSVEDPKAIFKKEIEKLVKELNIKQVISLSPFEKAHVLIVCERKW